MCFVKAKFVNDKRHQQGDIGGGQLTTSVVAYAHLSAYLERGLNASAMAYAHQSAIIRLFLTASPLHCTKQPSNLKRGLPTSVMACKLLSRCRRRLHQSSKACAHCSIVVEPLLPAIPLASK